MPAGHAATFRGLYPMSNRAVLACMALLPTLFAAPADAQLSSPAGSVVTVGQLEQAPVIDGRIGGDEWRGAAIIDQQFYQFQPDYGRPALFRTTVRVAQTATSLVFAFEAWDPEIGRYSATRTLIPSVITTRLLGRMVSFAAMPPVT